LADRSGSKSDWRASGTVAACLSFLWPGLGQWYQGRRRWAVVYAVPPLLAVALLAWGLRLGPLHLALQLLAERDTALAAIGVVALLGAWRVASIAAAFSRGRSHGTFGRLVVVVLVGLVALSHGLATAGLALYSNAGATVFAPNHSLADLSMPSGLVYQPLGSAGAATPSPSAAAGRRVTILVTGVDSGPDRSEHLYDSIMVVSFDPATNSVRMVSVPRDSSAYPLYFGGVELLGNRINSIPTFVSHGWLKSPDSPYMTLLREVSFLVGIPIDYYAVLDFAGFVTMVDLVGGIDVVNPTTISDGEYPWGDGSPPGFYLPAGTQHLDGRHALAYARTRHSDNDYARSSRQQQILIALLHKVAEPSQIVNLPTLVATMAQSLSTNFPEDEVADFVTMGQAVPAANIRQVVLGPPYSYPDWAFSAYTGASVTCLIMPKVAALSIDFFGADSLYTGKPAPKDVCPGVSQ
jgi:LCP family protein required for cell wall assembly